MELLYILWIFEYIDEFLSFHLQARKLFVKWVSGRLNYFKYQIQLLGYFFQTMINTLYKN